MKQIATSYSYDCINKRHKQINLLRQYKFNKCYVDKLSGKNADRPELKRLLTDVKPGDHVYVESISRLGRNVDDLRKLTKQFQEKNVTLHFAEEGFDTGYLYDFMAAILKAVAEMELETRAERIRDGIEKAKRYGTKSGIPIGRPPAVLPDSFEKYYLQMKAGKITKVEMAKLLSIGRKSVYRWIEQYEKEK